MMVLTQVDAFGDDSDNNKNGEDLWWVALKAANGKADGEEGEEGDSDQMLKEMFDKLQWLFHCFYDFAQGEKENQIRNMQIEKYDHRTNTITHSTTSNSANIINIYALFFFLLTSKAKCQRLFLSSSLMMIKILSSVVL